jgi:hypothetical protein
MSDRITITTAGGKRATTWRASDSAHLCPLIFEPVQVSLIMRRVARGGRGATIGELAANPARAGDSPADPVET